MNISLKSIACFLRRQYFVRNKYRARDGLMMIELKIANILLKNFNYSIVILNDFALVGIYAFLNIKRFPIRRLVFVLYCEQNDLDSLA